jgi:hypothetical protein
VIIKYLTNIIFTLIVAICAMQIMQLDGRYQLMVLFFFYPLNVVYYILAFLLVCVLKKHFKNKDYFVFSTLPNLMALLTWFVVTLFIIKSSSGTLYVDFMISAFPHCFTIVSIYIVQVIKTYY